MWHKEYRKTYQGVTKEAIWQTWADVNNWPKWDKDLEFCKLKDKFTKGSEFILRPRGGPNIKMVLSEVVPYKQFTDYCKFFGATMYDDHQLEETSEGLLIKSTITVTGLLSFIWVKSVAKNVANSVPAQLDVMVEYAKSSTSSHKVL